MARQTDRHGRAGGDLVSVVRRLRAGTVHREPSTAANEWCIAANGWQLVAPDGQLLDLNLPERLLLSRLFSTPRETVARDELIACVASTPSKSSIHTGLKCWYTACVAVCSKNWGESLPIRAIRGRGYMALVAAAPNGAG